MQLTFGSLCPLLVPHVILSPENSVHRWDLLGGANLHFTLYQVEGRQEPDENVTL